jgi:hypothetical protein
MTTKSAEPSSRALITSRRRWTLHHQLSIPTPKLWNPSPRRSPRCRIRSADPEGTSQFAHPAVFTSKHLRAAEDILLALTSDFVRIDEGIGLSSRG